MYNCLQYKEIIFLLLFLLKKKFKPPFWLRDVKAWIANEWNLFSAGFCPVKIGIAREVSIRPVYVYGRW